MPTQTSTTIKSKITSDIIGKVLGPNADTNHASNHVASRVPESQIASETRNGPQVRLQTTPAQLPGRLETEFRQWGQNLDAIVVQTLVLQNLLFELGKSGVESWHKIKSDGQAAIESMKLPWQKSPE